MTKQDVLILLEYDRWASRHQLEVVSGLTEDQYLQDLKSSHGGIRGTLTHIYGAQRAWLARWNGNSPTSLIKADEIPTLPLLNEKWTTLWDELSEYVHSLTEEQLQQPLTYKDLKGNSHTQPLIHQLQHVFNHCTYHRGQITTMLRQLGVTPVATDLIGYYRTLPEKI
jgi:uncharacterized damage-inducible protein DinB